MTEINDLLNSNNIHILAISETHIDHTVSDNAVNIQGYSIYRKDRSINGGGVALYIQSHIPAKIRQDLMPSSIEALWLQVHLPHVKPLLIGCCYRPPSAKSEYLDTLCEMMIDVCDTGNEVYLMGDLNIHWLSHECPLKNKVESVTNACALTQVITKNTRICINSAGKMTSTCIDHIFTNAVDLCSKGVSVPIGCSDHNIVAIARKAKVPKVAPKVIYKRSYKGFCQESFCKDVGNICWAEIYKEENPDEATKAFEKVFYEIIDKHAKVKKFTVKNFRAPWIDQDLKECMVKRDVAKGVANMTGNKDDWQIYCKLRNQVTNINRKNKRIYFKSKLTECKYNGKKLWNTLNDIMGRKPNSTASFIDTGESFLTKPSEIADYFNSFFINKVDKLRSEMSSTSNASSYSNIEQKIMKGKNCQFELKKVNVEKVQELLSSIKNDKPAGKDDLDGKLLKMVASDVAGPVCHIFNASIASGIFPVRWKEAKVTPLPKNINENFSGKNSRPISLLPILSKLLEKIVTEQIQGFFMVNKLFSNFQHAYREGHSTGSALTQITDDCLRHIDNKHVVGAVLLDFSAAFDLIDHTLLLNKLKCYNFTNNSIEWFKSYLSNRKQYVFYNGSFSQVGQLQCGVPQGSCLGPVLFSIFTNDLPLVLNHTTAVMYADDTTLYMPAKSIDHLTVTMNSELVSVLTWVENNKLVLNLLKTKSIAFGSKFALKNKPKLNIVIKGMLIEQVEETKLLGITLDSRFTWSKQIDMTVAAMGKSLSVIKRCSKYMPQQCIPQIVQTLALLGLLSNGLV